MHILTADEFIAQGTTAGAIMSIAAYPDQPRAAAERLRTVAREVALRTGQRLAIPGAVTAERAKARWRNARTGANDNRRVIRRAS